MQVQDDRLVASGVSIPISEVRSVDLKTTGFAKVQMAIEALLALFVVLPALFQAIVGADRDQRAYFLYRLFAGFLIVAGSEWLRNSKGWRLHVLTAGQHYTFPVALKKGTEIRTQVAAKIA